MLIYEDIILPLIFQKNFEKIPKRLRKCYFPAEGDLQLFQYYTEANCKMECAWKHSSKTCGCKPWYIPALDGETMCYAMGQLCFDQTMKKIEKEEIILDCDCKKDCVYTKYSLSVRDRLVLERLSSRGWTNESNAGEGFYNFGTDEMDGNDFSGSHWLNMGEYIYHLQCEILTFITLFYY